MTNTNETTKAWTEYAQETGYDEAGTWGEDEIAEWAWAEICAWYNNEHVQPTDMDTLLGWAHRQSRDTGAVLDITDAMIDMASKYAIANGLGTECSLY